MLLKKSSFLEKKIKENEKYSQFYSTVRHFLRFLCDTMLEKREGSEKMIKNGSQVIYQSKGKDLVIRVLGEIDHHGAEKQAGRSLSISYKY